MGFSILQDLDNIQVHLVLVPMIISVKMCNSSNSNRSDISSSFNNNINKCYIPPLFSHPFVNSL